MKLHFYKYQATGNDFVLVDNRDQKYSFTTSQIGKICDRRFGIGADGLILLEKDQQLDFKIVYFNGDGTQSLCGNGCRSAIDLASHLGWINGGAKFSAYDGPHEARLISNGLIRLRMNDVADVKEIAGGFFVDTGSPHFVKFVKSVRDYPVFEEGRKLRYSDTFMPQGANINFVELMEKNTVSVRTYERGVEDETLSCGTGVTAVSLAASFRGYISPVHIKVLGGELSVEFKSGQEGGPAGQPGAFHDIFLVGPAKLVFEGDLEL
jgi:diaminopimelate epimerase